MAGSKLPLAVTIGEPAGIGPDIILSAWAARKKLNLPQFVVVGDAGLMTRRAMALNLPISMASLDRGATAPPLSTALTVIPAGGSMVGEPGKPSPSDAPLVIEAIRIAVEMVASGMAAALVTAPIAKGALYRAGFSHPGHTEFLAELAANPATPPPVPVMMIASDVVRTIPVTIHIPLADVPGALTTEKILVTGRIAARDLTKWFGIAKPRIAVSGLNPHAGEGGSLGKEDELIIQPAVDRLRSEGIDATGPWPADTMFHAAARSRYDVAICMYHDQALIPAKALAFDEGVNVTLGLPFIRTSPDHGTAFDIAGTGKADPSSFIAALRMARSMADRHS